MPSLSRRALISGAAALCASPSRAVEAERKIAIFSKELQFLKDEALAECAAEIGFDGIDLTVRKGGHVEPDRVRQDLPRLAAIIRRQGLEIPMITTGIVDSASPFAADILATMQDLG